MLKWSGILYKNPIRKKFTNILGFHRAFEIILLFYLKLFYSSHELSS